MVGIPGFSKRLFEALALEKVNVILITQSSSEHSICVGVNTIDVEKAKNAVDAAFDYEITTEKVEPLVVEKDLSIVAVVGDKMKNHQGISGKMFGALGRNGINIRGIAQGSSERNLGPRCSVQRNNLVRPNELLRNVCCNRRKPRLGVRYGSRSYDQFSYC